MHPPDTNSASPLPAAPSDGQVSGTMPDNRITIRQLAGAARRGWQRWIPGLEMLRNYRANWLAHDILAGLVLTTILVPVGIAYATASGLPGIYGLYATIAMISALYHHRQTGEGQFIDAALLDAAVSFNGHLSIGYLMTGVSPKRAGNTNPIAAPADVYPCKDGYLIIAAGNNGQFNALCKALGLQALAADPRFSTNPQRIANRALMQQSLLPETVKYTKAQLLTRLEQAGVPSGPINNMAEVFADPQTQHRKIAIDVPHSSGVNVKLVRNPLLFSRTPVQHRAPPMLGEHSEQVLMDELGLTLAQIQGLRDRKIV